MKVEVNKLSRMEFEELFPLDSKVPGWRYRISESSNFVWLVEIANQSGHMASRRGSGIDSLISECEADAIEINSRVNDA